MNSVQKNINGLRKILNQKQKLRDDLLKLDFANKLTKISAEKQFEPVLSKLDNLSFRPSSTNDFTVSRPADKSGVIDKETSQILENDLERKQGKPVGVVTGKIDAKNARRLYRKSIRALRTLENRIRRANPVDSTMPSSPGGFTTPMEPSQDPLAETPRLEEETSWYPSAEYVQRRNAAVPAQRTKPEIDDQSVFTDLGTPKSSSTPQTVREPAPMAATPKRTLLEPTLRDRSIKLAAQKMGVDARKWISLLSRLDPTVDQSHYGPRITEAGRIKLGDAELEFGADFVKIGNKKYALGRGLANLIFAKDPQGYSAQDLKTYGEILFKTNAIYEHYDKFEKFHRDISNRKFKNVINAFLPSRTNLRIQTGKQMAKSPYKRMQNGRTIYYLSEQFLKKLLNGK